MPGFLPPSTTHNKGNDSRNSTGNSGGNSGRNSSIDTRNSSGNSGRNSGIDSRNSSGNSGRNSSIDTRNSSGNSGRNSGIDSRNSSGNSGRNSGGNSGINSGIDSRNSGGNSGIDSRSSGGNSGGNSGNGRDSSIVNEFERMLKRAGEWQEEVLKEILTCNADTEYLARFQLAGKTDVATFRQRVPVVAHSDLVPYINRIVLDGDQSSILTAAPIHTVSLSSGTTNGHHKYIPWYEEMAAATIYIAKLASALRSRVYPMTPNGRMLEFIYCGEVYKTKGGVKAGTATTHIFQREILRQKHKGMHMRMCSPPEVLYQKEESLVLYCHLLCGLLHWQEVDLISSTFAYTLVEAFRSFEKMWPRLCQAIRAGELNESTCDQGTRQSLGLVPNPELADLITAKMEFLGSKPEPYAGLIPCVWPKCRYILSIMTGTMEPYLDRLRHYAGSVPLVSADYGATEGWIGVNANPERTPADVSFTIVPTLAYFEFIPLCRRGTYHVGSAYEEVEAPVQLTEVKLGQEYEVVMTTYGGLYRYRLGDVLRVTGFYHKSPQFAYVCRKDVVLSLNIDKVTEKDLLTVINATTTRARKEAYFDLVDFTSYADFSSMPGHYIIYWEVQTSHARSCGDHVTKLEDDEELMQRCANILEMGLRVEPGYKCARSSNNIGPLQLCLVRRGTFSRLLHLYLFTTPATITQYKTPRCIHSLHLLGLLQSATLKSFFSSCP